MTSLAENCYSLDEITKLHLMLFFNAFGKSQLWRNNPKMCLAGIMEKECGAS